MYLHEVGDRRHPALLFLHGGGLSGRQWAPQIEALSGRFLCLVPDLPEQGRSAELAPFTLDDAVARVHALITERAPTGRVTVVGSSLGGAVGLALTAAHPEGVERLIVSGASSGLGPTLAWVTRVSASMLSWMPQELLIRQTFDQFRVPEPYRAPLRDDLALGLAPAFNRHVADALIRVPTPAQASALVLVGERETWLARRQARALAASISGAVGACARGLGHVWNLEAPDVFTATIEAFVAGAPLPEGVERW